MSWMLGTQVQRGEALGRPGRCRAFIRADALPGGGETSVGGSRVTGSGSGFPYRRCSRGQGRHWRWHSPSVPEGSGAGQTRAGRPRQRLSQGPAGGDGGDAKDGMRSNSARKAGGAGPVDGWVGAGTRRRRMSLGHQASDPGSGRAVGPSLRGSYCSGRTEALGPSSESGSVHGRPQQPGLGRRQIEVSPGLGSSM